MRAKKRYTAAEAQQDLANVICLLVDGWVSPEYIDYFKAARSEYVRMKRVLNASSSHIRAYEYVAAAGEAVNIFAMAMRKKP